MSLFFKSVTFLIISWTFTYLKGQYILYDENYWIQINTLIIIMLFNDLLLYFFLFCFDLFSVYPNQMHKWHRDPQKPKSAVHIMSQNGMRGLLIFSVRDQIHTTVF